MFEFIHKRDLFKWWDGGHCDKNQANWHLKGIQDGFASSMIRNSDGLTICEVGGGIPRVLPKLASKNECWNIDKLEGAGNGPTEAPELENIKLVDAFLGDFDDRLPDDYFDIVFSLSVIEHVPDDALDNCFKDMARILKPGGKLIHAIDLYVPQTPTAMPRVERYRNIAKTAGTNLEWMLEPTLPEKVGFRTSYACNSDQQLANWNSAAPSLRKVRENHMNCSIKSAWIKPES